MSNKKKRHKPGKWLAGAFLAAGLIVMIPASKPVYADPVATGGFNATSASSENDVSVKRWGHYNLLFNGNGSDGGSMKDYPDVLLDDPVSLKNGFTKTGYHFTGWKDDQGNDYSQDVSATADTFHTSDGKTITLKAQWEPNHYSVRFHKNRDSASGTMKDQEFTYDQTGLLSNNMFTQTGYQFRGWSESAKGDIKFTNMNRIVRNLTAKDGAVVDLYAQWTDGEVDLGKLVKDAPTHQHIYLDKYDGTYHWKECSICGNVIDKEKHSFGNGYWVAGRKNCFDTYVETCKCGATRRHTDPHTYSGTFYPSEWCQHHDHCTVCGLRMEGHDCIDANGKPLSCLNPGTCRDCGRVWTADDHILKSGGVCQWCGKKFINISNQHTEVNGRHVKFIWTYEAAMPGVSVINDDNNTFSWWAPNTEPQNGRLSSTGTNQKRIYTYEFDIPADDKLNIQSNWSFGYSDAGAAALVRYNGHVVVDGSGVRFDIDPDRSNPVINTAVAGKNPQNGWARQADITVSGTDPSSTTREYILIQDKEGHTVYRGDTAVSNHRYSFTGALNVEGNASGNSYKVTVSNTFGSSSTANMTVKNIDASAPVLLNPLNNKGKWFRSVEWTADVTENASGGVKIGMNQVKDMNDSSRITGQNGHYYKKYVFDGDKYDDETYRVFTEDAAGNLASYEMNIGKLDNTAPHVNKVDINDLNVSVTADDKNTSLGEGSGVAKYGYIDTATGTAVVEEKNASFALPHAGRYLIVAYDAVGNLSDPYTVTVGENAGAKQTVFDLSE